MRKKMMAMCLAVTMVASACGCGGGEGKNTSEENTSGVENEQEVETPEEEEADRQQEMPGAQEGQEEVSESLFTEFKTWQFTYSSGAGGWGTMMQIDVDGTFSGEYFDGELGATGEGYPNGTQYRCDFNGKFTEPVKVNDFTYSMQIAEISYEKEPGTEEIIDGMLFCYEKPYGLDGAEDILLYAPGAPLTELPEEYRYWVGYSDPVLETSEETELPFWGLYNEAEECGFASYDLIGGIKQSVAYWEKEAALLEASIENDALTEIELNDKAGQLYRIWDYTLNDVWDVLRQTLDADAMNTLLAEQREWIAMKEQAVEEAGAEVGGGSMQPMVMDLKAAELTKARVHELMELLEKNEK